MKNPFGAINAIDNALAFARAGRLLDQTAIDQLASVREEINQEFPHDEDGKPIAVEQEDKEKVHRMTDEEFVMLAEIPADKDIFLSFYADHNYFELDSTTVELENDLSDDVVEKLEDIGSEICPRNVASGDLEINMPKREISIHAKTLHT